MSFTNPQSFPHKIRGFMRTNIELYGCFALADALKICGLNFGGAAFLMGSMCRTTCGGFDPQKTNITASIPTARSRQQIAQNRSSACLSAVFMVLGTISAANICKNIQTNSLSVLSAPTKFPMVRGWLRLFRNLMESGSCIASRKIEGKAASLVLGLFNLVPKQFAWDARAFVQKQSPTMSASGFCGRIMLRLILCAPGGAP
jgi:hypothetical protein